MSKSPKKSECHRVVLVMGMHRSGTSALAGCISELGATAPPNLLPPTPDNPKGYWESSDLMYLHNEMLDSVGLSWSDSDPLPKDWFVSKSVKTFKNKIAGFLDNHLLDNNLLVIKDPRICRIAPIWLEVLAAKKIKTYAIFPVRNPLEVANSLLARDNFSIEYSCLLWLRHILEAEKHTRGLARSFIKFENLINNPKYVLEKASAELGLLWPDSSKNAWGKVSQLVDAKIKHHTSEPEDLESNSELSKLIKRSYDCFSQLCDPEIKRSRVFDQLDGINFELSEIDILTNPVFLHKNKLLLQRKGQLREKSSEVNAHKDYIAELSKLIDSHKKTEKRLVDEQEKIKEYFKGQLDDAVKTKEWLLEEHKKIKLNYQEQLERAQQDIVSISAESAARSKYIDELQKVLTSLRNQLAELNEDYSNLYILKAKLQEIADSYETSKLSRLHKAIRVLDGKLNSGQFNSAITYRDKLVIESGLFDPDWYIEHYSDVSESQIDPWEHFIKYGFREHRDPGPKFSTLYYVRNNPDVLQSGLHPLIHFLEYGIREGRLSVEDNKDQ